MLPDALEERIASYKRRKLLDYDLPSMVAGEERFDIGCIKLFLQFAQLMSTRQLRGFAINPQSLDDTLINLIFFTDDPDNAFREFHGNCAYTGYKNIIVGDLRFIRDLAGIDNVPQYPLLSDGFNVSATIRAMMANVAAIWVIGHEIGHLACGHDLRHFRFDGEGATGMIQNRDGKPNGVSFTIEQQADEFVWQALDGIPIATLVLASVNFQSV
jgi:hypothetical protein